MAYPPDTIRIASSIPGRLRLRGALLRDLSLLDRLSGKIAQWRHVSSVDANSRTGSLLVHYDAACLEPDVVMARIDKAIAGYVQLTHRNVGQIPMSASGGSSRVRVNRYAKRGMLLSLSVSLLLAGAGLKRWHALTGGLFVASLAVHLWVHRRHVLR